MRAVRGIASVPQMCSFCASDVLRKSQGGAPDINTCPSIAIISAYPSLRSAQSTHHCCEGIVPGATVAWGREGIQGVMQGREWARLGHFRAGIYGYAGMGYAGAENMPVLKGSRWTLCHVHRPYFCSCPGSPMPALPPACALKLLAPFLHQSALLLCCDSPA